MAQQGWVKIHRKLRECYLWEDKEPFDKRSAWIDLLLSANHADKKTLINNVVVLVNRGSFITSEVKLSERWKWDRGKVRRFLKLLEDDEMIKKISTSRKYITVSIMNYDIYQSTTSESIENSSVEAHDTTSDEQVKNMYKTSKEHVANINKNDKECSKNEKNVYSEEFEEFYSLYPNPFNKAQTFKNWIKLLKSETVENVMKATDNYIRYIKVKKIDEQYIVRSTNFIGQKEEYKAYLEVSIQTKERTGVKADNTKLIRREDY